MIKIGVFGLSGETIQLVRKIRQQSGEISLLFFTHGMRPDYLPEKHSFYTFTDQEGLVFESDKLIFSNPQAADMSFIKMALRQSKPLFFLDTRHLNQDALNEIVALSGEAKAPAVCYNPVWTHPVFNKVSGIVEVPFYAEVDYRLPASQFNTERATNHLLFSLESVLRLFRTLPKKPVVRVYSAGMVQADIIHVRLDFDNNASVWFKYEGISETEEFSCRLIQTGHIVMANMISGDIQHQQMGPDGFLKNNKFSLRGNRFPLYTNWQNFLSGNKSKYILLEDRLVSSRIHHYIRDKVRYMSLTGQQALKSLQ